MGWACYYETWRFVYNPGREAVFLIPISTDDVVSIQHWPGPLLNSRSWAAGYRVALSHTVTRSEPRTQKAVSSRYEQCNVTKELGGVGWMQTAWCQKRFEVNNWRFFFLPFSRVKTRSQDVDLDFPLEDMRLFVQNQRPRVRILHLL